MQYQGNTVAQYSPLQKQSYCNAANMQSAPQLQCASALAGQAGLAALNTGYTYNPYTAQQVTGAQATAAQLGPAPTDTAAQFKGPGSISYCKVNGPGLSQYQMNGPQQVSTNTFNACAAKQYMNAYTCAALQPQLALMRQQQGMQQAQNQAAATNMGAFGGARCAVLTGAQNQANQLAQQNLVGNAYNQAYKCAQQMFTTCQARNLQAQQANQQAGLTTGTQNLQAMLATQGLCANLNQQAKLANQQAGLTAGQFNATMCYNTALQNAQFAQQSGLANQALQGQYGLQQGQFCQQTNLANQASTNQAALANQAAAQAAANLNAQQSQFGANLGLQGLQTANASASNLANIGNTQYTQNMGITNLQNQYGAQQQAQCQALLNAKYQCFMNAQNYEGNQLAAESALLRGLPMSNTSNTTYAPAPSTLSQLTGAALAASAANKIAKGGAIKSKKGGLKCLALAKIGV